MAKDECERDFEPGEEREENTRVSKMKWVLYQRVVEYFTRLSGLKDFLVHISYPVGDDQACIRHEHEKYLVVMGDDYDSFARGKRCKWR